MKYNTYIQNPDIFSLYKQVLTSVHPPKVTEQSDVSHG